MSSGLARLFVYGTLMPGHLRWEMLRGVAVDHRPASADGVLYDTGFGWPAARFAGGGTVPGWVVDLEPGALDSVLALLDEVEDGFIRVVVWTSSGESAWAYEAADVPASWAVIETWEGRAER